MKREREETAGWRERDTVLQESRSPCVWLRWESPGNICGRSRGGVSEKRESGGGTPRTWDSECRKRKQPQGEKAGPRSLEREVRLGTDTEIPVGVGPAGHA